MSQSLIIRKSSGNSLTVTRNGATAGGSYTLLPATASVLGGVKTGSGVTIDGTGLITVTAAGIGLGSVDNTSDLNKPVSTATQAALDGKAAITHTHVINDVTGLQTALDGKQASGSYVLTSDSRLSDARTPLAHNQAWSTITATPTTLAGYGITDAYSSSNPSGYITVSALSGYLTTSAAAATYATISSLTSYLTTATASTTYTPQTRTIAAGTGLSGGGDLSANRTLSLAASGVAAGTYGSGSIIPKITVDTYGRITGVVNDTVYPDWNNISSKPIDSSTGTAVFSMAANLADYELIRAKLKDYSETRATPAISAGSLTLNLETANFFAVSLNANVSTAIVISNPPATGSVGSFTLELTANGTPYTINWGSIKWPGGTPPTLTSASGKRDIFVFYTTDGGTNWYGLIGGQNL